MIDFGQKRCTFYLQFLQISFLWFGFFLVFGQNSTKQALVLGLGPTPIRRWRNVTYLHYFCNHFKYSRLVLHECNRKSSNTVVFKKERNGNLKTFLCTTLNLFFFKTIKFSGYVRLMNPWLVNPREFQINILTFFPSSFLWKLHSL